MSNISLKQELDSRQLAIAQSELENKKKSTVIAYVLWFFLGSFGGHRYFVGKIGSGIAMAALWLIGVLTTWLFIGFLFLAILYVWVIIDAFLLHGWVSRYNERLEREILLKLSK